MDFSPLKIAKRRDSHGIRLTAVTGLLAVVLLVAADISGILRTIHNRIGSPAEFRVRELLQVGPHVSPRLKILALDDSAYALLRKPYLSGEDWAEILGAIGGARPQAIVTTHMFGTGEFTSDDDLLSNTLRKLRENGTAVLAGAFASPRTISFRTPLSEDHTTPDVPARVKPVTIPGGKFYGPDAAHAHKFTGLGHLAYDGTGRIPAYQRTDGGTLAHISYAAGRRFNLSIPEMAGSEGYETVNIPSISHLTKPTKSLKHLLGADSAAWAARLVQPDDIVLILSDMYTGKVNFANTPLGPVPSGYIVASSLNSMLTGQHLKDRSAAGVIVLIFLLLGLSCGLAPGPTWFAASFACGLIVIPGIGLLSFAVTGVILPWVSASAFFAGPALILFFRRTQIRLSQFRQRNAQIEKETEKLNAIVRTAQMFAHDVRKPFSMLNMTAQSIQKITDTGQIIRFMNRMLPELERSMASVEGMIHDIMEIDSRGSVSREDTGTAAFLAECLREAFILRDARNVAIEYDLQHSMDLSIDRQKIRRVVINIIDNALGAMNNAGRLWLVTCDASENGNSYVEVTIGNSNSWIAPENLQRIFEAFYTSGKKDGTGLGLAIAQKVILEHGGSISARSGRGSVPGDTEGNQDWTEFVFTLPVAYSTPAAQPTDIQLPKSSDAFFGYEPLPQRDDEAEAQAAAHRHAAEKLRGMRASLGRAIRILVIDDETVYLDSMKTILSGGVFSGIIDADTANSSTEAFSRAQTFNPDLILCDIDMGPDSLSGFEIVERMRKDDVDAYIVMHSNRVFHLDSTRASDVGADHFLPKPINEIKLMTVITDGLAGIVAKAPPAATAPASAPFADIVVVVDDDVFTLEAWEAILDDATVKTFESPTAFWEFLAANKPFINDIKLIVTDYYFDNEAEENGETFARRIKEIGNIPVVLSSNGSFSGTPDVFDAVIGKEPDTWLGLQKKIGTKVKAS